MGEINVYVGCISLITLIKVGNCIKVCSLNQGFLKLRMVIAYGVKIHRVIDIGIRIKR